MSKHGTRSTIAILVSIVAIVITAIGATGNAYAVDDTFTMNYDGNGKACWVVNDPSDPEQNPKLKSITYNYDQWAPIYEPGIRIPEEASSQHLIRFNGNGGLVDGQEVKPIEMATYKSSTEFVNWNTAKDGSGTTYEIGDSYTKNEDITLYAQWKENNSTDIIAEAPTAIRDGYTLDGWYDQAEGGKKYMDAGTKPSEEALSALPDAAILYAHWTAVPETATSDTTYTVKFFSGDVLISEQQVAGGSAATAPAAPQAPAGKVFAGWDKDFSNVTGDLEIHAVFTAPSGTIAATGDMAGTGLMSIIAITIVLAAGLAVVRKKQ